MSCSPQAMAREAVKRMISLSSSIATTAWPSSMRPVRTSRPEAAACGNNAVDLEFKSSLHRGIGLDDAPGIGDEYLRERNHGLRKCHVPGAVIRDEQQHVYVRLVPPQ